MRRSLRWWLRLLDTGAFQRRIPFEQVESKPWIVYGDASMGWLGLTALDTRTGEKFQFSTASMLARWKDQVLAGERIDDDESTKYDVESATIQLYETE